MQSEDKLSEDQLSAPSALTHPPSPGKPLSPAAEKDSVSGPDTPDPPEKPFAATLEETGSVTELTLETGCPGKSHTAADDESSEEKSPAGELIPANPIALPVNPRSPFSSMEADKALSPSTDVLPPAKRKRITRSTVVREIESDSFHKYVLRFEGNDSRKWDGKEVTVEPEQLEGTYDPADIVPGAVVQVPYPGRDGEIELWKGVIMPKPVEREGKLHVFIYS